MSEETLIYTFTKLRKRFRLMAKRFLHDDDEADDVLQDAFCRLWPRKDALDDLQEAQALTAVTVEHLCIDKLRQRQSRPTVSVDAERDATEVPSPSDSLEMKESFWAVEHIIESALTPLQREILRRREYDGEDYADIATALKMQEAAVRMQLSRARKTIRSIYQKQKQ